jgi:hypothetical protein
MSTVRLFVWPAVASFAVGSALFGIPGAGGTNPGVYEPPRLINVVRTQDRVTYSAIGKKLRACEIHARFVAEIEDEDGRVIDRSPINLADGTMGGGSDWDSVPSDQEFSAKGLWFRAKNAKILRGARFFVAVPCYLDSGDRVVARWGPFPLPPQPGQGKGTLSAKRKSE